MALTSSQYVGNADFRGYLSALAAAGDGQAQQAVKGYNGYGYVDNNGKINTGLLNELNQSAPGGAQGDAQLQQNATNYVNNAYATYQKLANAPAASGLNATSSGADQADTAQYWADQQTALQQQADQLDPQQQTGLNNILGSYNSAFQTLQNGGQDAENQYNTTKATDINNNETAKNQINQNVQQNNTAIQRLLGSKGAGSSSAATISAPLAVATQGNAQRTAQNTAFGANQQGLDTSINKERTDLANSVGNLQAQRVDKENTLKAGIAQSRVALLQQQANAALQAGQAKGQSYLTARAAETPYQSQIQALLGQIDSLGAQPTFTPQAVNYTPPSIASYSTNRAAAPTISSGQPGGADTSGAGSFYTLLNGQQKQNGTLTA